MNTNESQQYLKVFTDYDEKQREKHKLDLKNDLKPATRTWPRAQTQQRKSETNLYGTMSLQDREYVTMYFFWLFMDYR